MTTGAGATSGAIASKDAAPERFGGVDVLELFLHEVGRYPLLSAAEEVDLAKRIERGDRGAKDKLINSNLRLVVSLARRYQSHQLPLLDVIQEGILGLIRATEKFDWRRGHKFSTYAVWWIREAIERGVANRARMIRMPVYMIERERKIRHVERTLTAELGREPHDDEVAKTAMLPLEKVRDVRRAARWVTSLDVPVGEDEDRSLGDLLVCQEAEPPEEVEVTMRHESLHRALGKLPDSECQIVKLRFGIDGEPRTIEQVMSYLNISRDRVRRLESKALARLARSPDMEELQTHA